MYVQSSSSVIHQPKTTVKCVRFSVSVKCLYGFDVNDKPHLLDQYHNDDTAEKAHEMIYNHLAAGENAVKMDDIRKELGLSS